MPGSLGRVGRCSGLAFLEGYLLACWSHSGELCSGVTIEFQRRQAKEMLAYFKGLKLQEEVQKAK